MKRIWMLVFLLAPLAHGQKFLPPPVFGNCISPSGAVIRIASSGTFTGLNDFPPPDMLLYGVNGTTPTAVPCDSSGHLISTLSGDANGPSNSNNHNNHNNLLRNNNGN